MAESFSDIVGNDNVKEFLNNQIDTNHILHSYLFVGIDGIGKTLFAREVARKLLCNNKEDSEDCISCNKFKSRKPSGF